MSKTIDTLVEDIYHVLRETTDAGLLDTTKFGDAMGKHLNRALSSREQTRDEGKLYASEYGDSCHRKLWYKIHTPDIGESLQPHTRFKFLYGDVLETIVLELAKQAGHAVELEQERIEVPITPSGGVVTGRLDAVIDGEMVDVKSMSTYAFNKLKADGGLRASNDSFGYRWQVGLYDSAVTRKGVAYILGIDKQNGHIGLFPVLDLPAKDAIARKLASAYVDVYENEEPPPRGHAPLPEGASGNEKLDIPCSYCSFKWECWPTLRAFAYSRGPTFLTKVDKEPKVPELKREEADE